MNTFKVFLTAALLSASCLIYAKEDTCDTGGVNTSHCVAAISFTDESGYGGSTVSMQAEITCEPGYYSCCNFGETKFDMPTATCKPSLKKAE